MFKLIELVPSSIRNDPQVQAACESLDLELAAIYSGFLPETSDPSILFWPTADEQNLPLLDHIGWEMHVDIWQNFEGDPLTIEKRRELIRESIAWHQKKGTKWVCEQMLKTVYGSGLISEWYEYGGTPYHFRVTTNEPIGDPDRLKRVIDAILAVKNVRSWMEEFAAPAHVSRAQMYAVVVIGQRIKNTYISANSNQPRPT